LAGIGQRWLEVERAMGIEYIAKWMSAYTNQALATEAQPCVRFLCEKRRHASQRQPTPANLSDVNSPLPARA
jgi:hypothetical protein